MNEHQKGVYAAINKVQSQLAKVGIAKDRKNTMQNYQFRGIDDVYSAIAPLLAENGLCIIPRITRREVTKETNSKGTTLFYAVVEAEFDFVCSSDGSLHTARTFGEAMDSGDKATNKAMSAAIKYAILMTFTIPTEGDNDTENSSHQVVSPQASRPISMAKPASAKTRCWEIVAKNVAGLTKEGYKSALVSMSLIDESTDLSAVTEAQWTAIYAQLAEFYK